MNVILRRLAGLAVLLLPGPAFGGETLLTISTDVGPKTYDRAALEEMDSVTFRTSTIWTDGVQTFKGVSLVTLLKSADVSEGTLKAIAINDYAVEIPVSDAIEDGPIVAYARNGEIMTIRDKGPLWLVYPYDSNPDYRSEITYSRSVWQLDRLELIR